MEIPAYKLTGLLVAFSLLALVPTAFAQQTPRLQIKSFSVGPDQTLSYPESQLNGLPDVQTTDLKNFGFATALGYNPQVMSGPVLPGQCNSSYTIEFDGNYAAPGSVV